MVEVDICYAVFYRHMMMPGGVLSYGSAEIVDYFDSFENADSKAKEIFAENEGAPDLHVWIMRCVKTYQNAGVAIERGFGK
jgi:hypothetical protein